MAPEVFQNKKYDKSVDWWAVGIILYELMFGANPFNLRREELTWDEYKDNVETLDPVFPEEDILCTDTLKNIIQKLLQKDPKERLDFDKEQSGVTKWLEGVDYQKIIDQGQEAMIIPEIEKDLTLEEYYEIQ